MNNDTAMARRVISIFFTAAALALCFPEGDLLAQESPPSPVEKQQTTPERQPAAKQQKESAEPEDAAPKTKNEKNKTSETFIPTEEISEDLSVSFPVDI